MDLPVGLTGDVEVVEVTSVVLRVSSSQKQLATRLRCRVPEGETGGFFKRGSLRNSEKNVSLILYIFNEEQMVKDGFQERERADRTTAA